MESQITQQNRLRIQALEDEIKNKHIPANGPLASSILSVMLPISPFVFHGIWNAVSPDTYSPECEKINHIIADTAFIGYNAFKLATGRLRGCVRKLNDYVAASDELDDLDYQVNWSILREDRR